MGEAVRQKANIDMANKLYDRQSMAWALDKAMLMMRDNAEKYTLEEATALAHKLLEWVEPAPDAGEVN